MLSPRHRINLAMALGLRCDDCYPMSSEWCTYEPNVYLWAASYTYEMAYEQ